MWLDALYRPQCRRHNAPGGAFQNSWRHGRQLCLFICGFSKKELVNSEKRAVKRRGQGARAARLGRQHALRAGVRCEATSAGDEWFVPNTGRSACQTRAASGQQRRG